MVPVSPASARPARTDPRYAVCSMASSRMLRKSRYSGRDRRLREPAHLPPAVGLAVRAAPARPACGWKLPGPIGLRRCGVHRARGEVGGCRQGDGLGGQGETLPAEPADRCGASPLWRGGQSRIRGVHDARPRGETAPGKGPRRDAKGTRATAPPGLRPDAVRSAAPCWPTAAAWPLGERAGSLPPRCGAGVRFPRPRENAVPRPAETSSLMLAPSNISPIRCGGWFGTAWH